MRPRRRRQLLAEVIQSTGDLEQLWQARGQPKSQEEQRVVDFLKNDAQARTEFLNKVAGPDREQDVRMRHDSLSRADRTHAQLQSRREDDTKKMDR